MDLRITELADPENKLICLSEDDKLIENGFILAGGGFRKVLFLSQLIHLRIVSSPSSGC